MFDSAPNARTMPHDTVRTMAPPISTAASADPRVHRVSRSRERGYPPSVREIGEAVGLTSPSTVHSHLNTLQRLGYLRRDPTKPRAIEVRYDTEPRRRHGAPPRPPRARSSATSPPAPTCSPRRTSRSCCPVPVDFTGDGELFMLRVRGDSMIELGILDGDFVVATPDQATANNGDIVVAGIPGGEATVKTYSRSGADGHARPRRTPRWSRWSSPPTRSRSTARSSP